MYNITHIQNATTVNIAPGASSISSSKIPPQVTINRCDTLRDELYRGAKHATPAAAATGKGGAGKASSAKKQVPLVKPRFQGAFSP